MAVSSIESSAFAGGDRSVGAPYQIENWYQLDVVRAYHGKHFILNNNLDKSSSGYNTYASTIANDNAGWLPIGDAENVFSGQFNGNSKLIKGLVISGDRTNEAGLFGNLEEGQIKNGGVK